MENRRLYVWLCAFLLVACPLYSYADPYEQDEWGYEPGSADNTAYYSDDQSSTVETYNAPRHYRSDNSARYDRDVQQSTSDAPQYTYAPPRRAAYHEAPKSKPKSKSFARLPQHISAPGERLIIVDPSVHAWGAYNSDGSLVRQGLATAGANWCDDIDRPCRTTVGNFRITSLGSEECISNLYPVGEGGAPMPYCMHFNGGQALHGSYEVVDANASHGCVRMRVHDAEWLRYNFAQVGTRVVVRPY